MASSPNILPAGSPVSDMGSRPEVYLEDGPPPLMLDPRNSERQHWIDPYSGVKREVWRPGDGDGDPEDDYFGRLGMAAPLRRWRFYQVQTGYGEVSRKNMPPSHVVLDDLAAWEVDVSNIPRTTRAQLWSHDFASLGYIRAQRRHRGRGAVGDPNSEGQHRYHFGHTAVSQFDKHYFTGEQYYRPIVYTDPNPKRKADVPPLTGRSDKRVRGLEPYTPQKAAKKHGMSSAAQTPSHSTTYHEPDSSPSALRHSSLMTSRSKHSTRAASPKQPEQPMLTVQSAHRPERRSSANDSLFMDPGNVCSPYIPQAPSLPDDDSPAKRIVSSLYSTPAKPHDSDSSEDAANQQRFTFHSDPPSSLKDSNQFIARLSSVGLFAPSAQQTRVADLETRTAAQATEIADLKARVTQLETTIEEWKAASAKLEDLTTWDANV